MVRFPEADVELTNSEFSWAVIAGVLVVFGPIAYKCLLIWICGLF